MADFNNIELRSEKVRNIIGKVPPEIIRTGISRMASRALASKPTFSH